MWLLNKAINLFMTYVNHQVVILENSFISVCCVITCVQMVCVQYG